MSESRYTDYLASNFIENSLKVAPRLESKRYRMVFQIRATGKLVEIDTRIYVCVE